MSNLNQSTTPNFNADNFWQALTKFDSNGPHFQFLLNEKRLKLIKNIKKTGFYEKMREKIERGTLSAIFQSQQRQRTREKEAVTFHNY